jgi:hypothetical protein
MMDALLLVVVGGAVVTLASIGNFYELRISLASGDAVTAVLSKSAIKISREGTKP